ncbi:MAG: hypothetical protein LBF25_02785 [Puniceicoccales bacterium]|jgi:hypothetical protein|nr:hypothetical protein [Puniceicoccales bacterium]
MAKVKSMPSKPATQLPSEPRTGWGTIKVLAVIKLYQVLQKDVAKSCAHVNGEIFA